MAGNQGLGSDNMSQADKDRIHSEGGKASHGTGSTPSSSRSTGSSSRGTTTNKSGGGGITKEDQRRGGRNSQK